MIQGQSADWVVIDELASWGSRHACPHCGSDDVDREYQEHVQVSPAQCNRCGATEFYSGDCAADATPEEVWCGWWMGEGAKTGIVLTSLQLGHALGRQQDAEIARQERQEQFDRLAAKNREQEAAEELKRKARQRYVDEALF